MSDKIIVLSDKDQARKRINVFHGSSSNWINMIKELVGNSLDIFNPEELNEIKIILHPDNTIEYIDSGKGIPIEGTASDGRKNYEAIFEKAFAGSKYNNTGATVGQNGIFLFTLAMTCEDIEFFIARPNGNIYNISYHKGDKNKDLSIVGKSDKTYSKIIFKLDEDVWSNVNFTYNNICSIAQTQASLGNVKIYVEDKANNQSIEYHYPEGIKDYFKEITNHKSMISDVLYMNRTEEVKLDKGGQNVVDKVDVEFLFSYSNDSEEDIQKDFLNTADLLQHGTIQDGIVAGLKNSIHKWLKTNNKYSKNEKGISNDDILTGLNYVCNVKSLYVEYDNQVKIRTSAQHYKPVLQNIVNSFMELYFIECPMDGWRIANQVLINKRAKEKADTIRKDVRKKLEEKVTNSNNRPEKFVPCRSKNPKEIELILIEGESAKNSVVSSRDSKTMCVYPLKGKPMNVLKKDIDSIMKNTEIQDIYKILGCGISYNGKNVKGLPHFNMDNLQVDKVIVLTDADSDGLHIQALLTGIFYTLSEEIIKQGKLYILYAPLYIIKTKNDDIFAYSEEERNDIIRELNNSKVKFTETRYKGIGGLSVQAMSKTAMSRDNRKMKQLTWEDAVKCKELLELCLTDEKAAERKEFIETNGHKFFDYSILEG